MLYTEKDAKRVHEACNDEGFFFILRLLEFEDMVHEVCNNGDFLGKGSKKKLEFSNFVGDPPPPPP